MSIERLVERAQLGDKEALLTLILQDRDRYYRLAYRYVGNEQDALDALENMIVVLYEKINTLKQPSSFYSWSKTILVHCCKDMIRKKNRVILVDEWDDSLLEQEARTRTYEAAGSHLEYEQRIDLIQYVNQLNEKHKEMISLKYWHDLDNQTIANILSIPIGTVKSRIHQGLKQLREMYRGEKNGK